MRSRMEGLLPLQVLRHLVFRLQHQAFHAFALDDVLLQDLFRVLDGAVGVPDLLGIDHHGGAELAAVEAQRLVDAHAVEAELLGARLHVVAQPLRALLLAAAARMALRPLVHAAEHVRLVIGRGIARLLAVGHDRDWLLRSYFFLPASAPPNCCQNAFCICSRLAMPAGSQVFIRVSGSIERIPAIMRSCISFITASCIGCRSGNPKNVRASSGVQSMSIWTFMGGPPSHGVAAL